MIYPHHVGFATLLLAALSGCSGCAPKAAPPVFAAAAPPPPALDLPVPSPDECPAVAAYQPGAPPPFAEGGLATCGGLLLPDSQYRNLTATGAYYDGLYQLCREHREADRAQCEAVAAQRWDYGEEMRHEARAARWATVGAAVGSIVLGLALGYAVGSLP